MSPVIPTRSLNNVLRCERCGNFEADCQSRFGMLCSACWRIAVIVAHAQPRNGLVATPAMIELTPLERWNRRETQAAQQHALGLLNWNRNDAPVAPSPAK